MTKKLDTTFSHDQDYIEAGKSPTRFNKSNNSVNSLESGDSYNEQFHKSTECRESKEAETHRIMVSDISSPDEITLMRNRSLKKLK